MAAKLINQTLVGIHAQAAVEVIFLAEQMDITDISELKALLSTSWGQSKILDLLLQDYIDMKTKLQQSINLSVDSKTTNNTHTSSSNNTNTTNNSSSNNTTQVDLLWDNILRANSAAPLRNMKKDFECIQKEVDLLTKGELIVFVFDT